MDYEIKPVPNLNSKKPSVEFGVIYKNSAIGTISPHPHAGWMLDFDKALIYQTKEDAAEAACKRYGNMKPVSHGLVEGEKKVFSTGAVREGGDKDFERFDLIPYDPLRRIAMIFGRGAVKYAPNNWKKGLPLSNMVNSTQRHLSKLAEGRTDEDHAAMAAVNMIFFMWTQDEIKAGRLPQELNDIGG